MKGLGLVLHTMLLYNEDYGPLHFSFFYELKGFEVREEKEQ